MPDVLYELADVVAAVRARQSVPVEETLMAHPTLQQRFETHARERAFSPNGPYPSTAITNWRGNEVEREWKYEHPLVQLLWECWNAGYDNGSEDAW